MALDKQSLADGDKISFLSPSGILTGVRTVGKGEEPNHVRVVVTDAKGRVVNDAQVAVTDTAAVKQAANAVVGPLTAYAVADVVVAGLDVQA